MLNKTWQAIWFHICDNWRSRRKTEVEGTRRLLDTVNAIKDTGELLLQMIENHQKMLEMSMRLENLMNDAKMATRRNIGWGDKSPPTPLPSEDWDVKTDNPLFYIPIKWIITVEQCPGGGGGGCNALHVAKDAPAPKLKFVFSSCVKQNMASNLVSRL